MQRISESAESLFGDLHKPFSTASITTGHVSTDHAIRYIASVLNRPGFAGGRLV
jgi:hypothetical protein